jgi:hypothetical protein
MHRDGSDAPLLDVRGLRVSLGGVVVIDGLDSRSRPATPCGSRARTALARPRSCAPSLA